MVLEALGSKWHEHFMELAIAKSKLSKDPHTHVGAVIVKGKKDMSAGYNGPPADFPDELLPQTQTDKLISSKNSYMIHAEENAILNYEGLLSNLKGATVYVTMSPCHSCMLRLASVGIKNVIYLDKYDRDKDEYATAQLIAEVCGINLIDYKELF